MAIDYRQRLVKRVREILAQHKGELFQSILVSAPEPNKLSSDKLPAAFYGTGLVSNNEDVRKGTSFRGETYTILLNVIFEKRTDDLYLIDTSAWLIDNISDIVLDFTLTIDTVVEATLQSVTPFSQGLSNREFLQFAIGIDFTYPID